jgi:hypothetical protein
LPILHPKQSYNLSADYTDFADKNGSSGTHGVKRKICRELREFARKQEEISEIRVIRGKK